VTSADSGKTFRLIVGQHLRVRLDGAGWSVPSATAPTLLERVSTKQRQDSTRAGFDAIKKGTSFVRSTQSGTRKTWSIRVIVG
jgi:hypothetical protein